MTNALATVNAITTTNSGSAIYHTHNVRPAYCIVCGCYLMPGDGVAASRAADNGRNRYTCARHAHGAAHVGAHVKGNAASGKKCAHGFGFGVNLNVANVADANRATVELSGAAWSVKHSGRDFSAQSPAFTSLCFVKSLKTVENVMNAGAGAAFVTLTVSHDGWTNENTAGVCASGMFDSMFNVPEFVGMDSRNGFISFTFKFENAENARSLFGLARDVCKRFDVWFVNRENADKAAEKITDVVGGYMAMH